LYELPAGYFRAIEEMVSAEIAREPSLGPFFGPYPEPETKRVRKDAELDLADVVFCASEYSRSTVFRYHPAKHVVVIPYGTDTKQPPKRWKQARAGDTLKLLYAGAIGPRKGIHYLFEALNGLPHGSCQVTLAGTWEDRFRQWLGHRHGIVEYSEVGRVCHERLGVLYRECDVFVFPTLSDGFGLVILEAMAAGVPVITTERSGGPDVIEHGKSGLIVPAGDPDALRRAIKWCLENRDLLPEMGGQARAAAESFSWARYRGRFWGAVSSSISGK
jgi:glycosyltransferase involved in cell wall biosynthesis